MLLLKQSLEVGYDPRSKERLVALEDEKKIVEKSLEDVDLNIKTLENLLRVQKKLPPEKAQYLSEQNEKRSELLHRLEEGVREIGQINAHLSSLTTIGKISASERVYPGVKLAIKNANLAAKTTLGSYTSSGNPRQVQLGLRFSF